jgi:hypothetical protein
MNANIWVPKMANDEIRAVINATKLMPCDPWAEPTMLVKERLVADMMTGQERNGTCKGRSDNGCGLEKRLISLYARD